jgi:tetratricopeptide (TPR) repeat protein/transcriptional regulator with XRE-family HTH domain
MARESKSDTSIVLRYLRETLGWSQVRLEKTAGLPAHTVNDYESGQKELRRGKLELVIAHMGLGPGRIDTALAEMEAVRADARTDPGDPSTARTRKIEAIAAKVGRLAAGFARAALHLLTLGGETVHAQDRADVLWRQLKRCPAEDRLMMVEEDRRFRTWGLCVLVVWKSLAAAPNHPKEALALAELAVHISGLVPGVKEWSWRLEGFALAALTNAHRVCNDLPAARKARVRARRLWEDGEPGDPGLLNPALLPWIEAALHRADRELPQALQRIEEALALDDGELRGKILLTKANIHDILDKPEASIRAIQEAIPLLDFEREPRLAWAVCHNLVLNLLHLGRAEEAREGLPEVRRLAEQLGGELDLHRVVWVEARVEAACGNLKEATKRFDQVRAAFTRPELSYDHALVSLDLSAVLLEQGETRRVRTIANEMAAIFRSQQVSSEALAALRVFCEAARREAATAEQARQMARLLQRAQTDLVLKEKAGAE